MEEIDIVKMVLERNSLDRKPYMKRLTPREYIIEKFKEPNFKINIEVKTAEISDETIRLEYKQVIDYDEEIEYITDMRLALAHYNGLYINAREIIPAIHEAKHEDVTYDRQFFIYRNMLLGIEGCGNCYISYKICNVPSDMIDLIKIVYGSLSKLSKKQAEEIAEQCSGQKITL